MTEVVVSLNGEFDISNAEQISGLVSRAVKQAPAGAGPLRIVLDLAGVTFLDCAAIHRILEAQDACARRGGELVVKNADSMIVTTFEVLGLQSRLCRSGQPARPVTAGSTGPLRRANTASGRRYTLDV